MADFYGLAYRAALPPFLRRLQSFREEGRARPNAPDSGVPVREGDLLFAADVFFGGRPPHQVDVLLVVQLHGLQVYLPQKPREFLLVAVLPAMQQNAASLPKVPCFRGHRDAKIGGLFRQ